MIDQEKLQKGRGWAYLAGIVLFALVVVEICHSLKNDIPDRMTIGKGKHPRDPNVCNWSSFRFLA